MNRLIYTGSFLIALAVAVPAGFSADDSLAGAGGSGRADSRFHAGEWPFNPPVRPAQPIVAQLDWVANPIDRFVLARLEQAGLQPSGAADKATLLRRVTFDLTGLPPTPAELDAFLADESPEAYERVVDRLLDSPRFGERWAQHWLDLVRYAETEGFKADVLRPNAFRYRDYVIDSLNSDRPFDEFIRQQLAGDELEPENAEAQIATGFLRIYPDEDNAANLFQRRQEILDDVTDTTSLVFLGLTMGCAQCHDHKFDEILQTDYYRLQAFFVSLAQRNDVPVASPAELAAYETDLGRWEAATAAVRGEIDAIMIPARASYDKFHLEKYEPAIVACYNKPADERTPYEAQIAHMVQWRMDRGFDPVAAAKKLSKDERKQLAKLQKQLAEFDSLKPASLPVALSVADVGRDAPPTHLLDGGNWKRPDALVEPGFPEFLGATVPPDSALANLSRKLPTTGRRTQLAQWLTRPDHPLTSRVIVNRQWQHHFGRGIVATPNDFGFQGERPTHPELLDWLAVELVENGWSLKHLHRLMVTSATYRLSSHVDAADQNTSAAMVADRDNKLLWRANRRRLEGEAIRDAMLQVSGELSFRMHGPSARPGLPDGISQRYAWEPDQDPADRNRRSVYVFAKRNMRFPLFDAFDQPDLNQSCARRAVTVTAPQSLAMLNSELTLELAQSWAERLVAEHDEETSRLIAAAYQSAFGRTATEEEIALAQEFLAEQSQFESKESHAAVAEFCHALFNSNEFITVD